MPTIRQVPFIIRSIIGEQRLRQVRVYPLCHLPCLARGAQNRHERDVPLDKLVLWLLALRGLHVDRENWASLARPHLPGSTLSKVQADLNADAGVHP